jgi:hypothetical protein
MSETQVTTAFKAHRHTRQAISLRGLRAQVKRADGVNAKIAVFLTKRRRVNVVGLCVCDPCLCRIPCRTEAGGEGTISWIALTFLQWSCCPSSWSGRTCRLRRAISIAAHL